MAEAGGQTPSGREPEARPSLFARAQSLVAGHATAALATIVVLAGLLIACTAYYRGLGPFGPYAEAGTKAGAKAGMKAGKPGGAGRADPETDSLIREINGA